MYYNICYYIILYQHIILAKYWKYSYLIGEYTRYVVLFQCNCLLDKIDYLCEHTCSLMYLLFIMVSTLNNCFCGVSNVNKILL